MEAARRRTGALLGRALRKFLDDHGPELSAAISYWALFSVFPVTILLAAVLGLVLGEQRAQDEVIGFVTSNVPLREEGRAEIESLLRGVTGGSGTVSGIAIVGILYAASALMGAVRNSLNAVWRIGEQRPFLRGKAVDVLLVFGLGALIAVSFATTLVTALTVDLAADLGLEGGVVRVVYSGVQFAIPIAISLAVFTVLFRYVPARRVTLRDVWPGILVATAGYELAKRGFAFYLENFSSYSVVYGSLGVVVAFMVFVYIAAIVFLLGAEAAALWPEVRDADLEPREKDPRPFRARLAGALKGLVVRGEQEERREASGRRG